MFLSVCKREDGIGAKRHNYDHHVLRVDTVGNQWRTQALLKEQRVLATNEPQQADEGNEPCRWPRVRLALDGAVCHPSLFCDRLEPQV